MTFSQGRFGCGLLAVAVVVTCLPGPARAWPWGEANAGAKVMVHPPSGPEAAPSTAPQPAPPMSPATQTPQAPQAPAEADSAGWFGGRLKMPGMPSMPAMPSMPGLPSMPSMPSVSMPDIHMPKVSLPDVFRSVGALPAKVGLPKVDEMIEQQFDRLVRKLNILVPAIESLGFEVRNFEVDWTLPPRIKLRLQSSEPIEDFEYDQVLNSVKHDLIVESVIMSLGGVRKIQRSTNLEAFRRAQLEVDLAIPPHVLMTFSDPSGKFAERFQAHRAELRRAFDAAHSAQPEPQSETHTQTQPPPSAPAPAPKP